MFFDFESVADISKLKIVNEMRRPWHEAEEDSSASSSAAVVVVGAPVQGWSKR